jgi:phosphoenolpyruvate carboxylase
VPVFTAHPTEARRRTTLEKLRRIADSVEEPGAGLARDQADDDVPRIAEEVTGLWQSDEVRVIRPTVLDEVKNGLYYFDATLYDVMPRLYRDLERALRHSYPDHSWRVPSVLRYGSWMGGDRDGNPYVTPDVTVETARLLRVRAIEHHIAGIEDLSHRLGQSIRQVGISGELRRSLDGDAALFPKTAKLLAKRNPYEAYRQKCTYIREKLLRSLEHAKVHQPDWGSAGRMPPTGTHYHTRDDLLADLLLIDRSLRTNGGASVADGALRNLIRQVEVFGLHTATLDIRQHSERHDAALDEVLRVAGVCDSYISLDRLRLVHLARRSCSRRAVIV